VDGRPLPGHRRQHPGPGGDPGVLLRRPEQRKTVALHGQHRSGSAGPGIDHHPGHRTGRVVVHWRRFDPEPVEHPGSGPGVATLGPAEGDGCRPGTRLAQVDPGQLAEPGGVGMLPVATPDLGDQPAGQQREPLLAGATSHRPTGHRHPGRGEQQRPEDTGHGRIRAQGEHAAHQSGRH
jgi:hypothetical protein